jgi:hypothetical protein
MAANQNGGGGQRSVINIYNNGPVDVETQEKPNGRGGFDLDVIIREKVKGVLAAGHADGVMGSRYGLGVQKRRR